METLVDVFAGILVLILGTWVLIFGGIGALLSHSRGGSSVTGLAWGVLGPIGWGAIWYRTRDSMRSFDYDPDVLTVADWSEDADRTPMDSGGDAAERGVTPSNEDDSTSPGGRRF